MKKSFECSACKKQFTTQRKWLELNNSTSVITDPNKTKVATEQSQGCFPFCLECAKSYVNKIWGSWDNPEKGIVDLAFMQKINKLLYKEAQRIENKNFSKWNEKDYRIWLAKMCNLTDRKIHLLKGV